MWFSDSNRMRIYTQRRDLTTYNGVWKVTLEGVTLYTEYARNNINKIFIVYARINIIAHRVCRENNFCTQSISMRGVILNTEITARSKNTE